MNSDSTNNPMRKDNTVPSGLACLTRRRFLLAAGGAAAGSTIFLVARNWGGGPDDPAKLLEAALAQYPRKKIGSLSALKTDVPATFKYPYEDLNSLNFLVKLGVPAGGGVGPASDVVAFNTLCTHMGGDLSDTGKTYLKEHKMLGSCPLHLSTYDLTRYGMVVAGHATESLPQVVLEVEGDDIYAKGILGLIYGKRDNLDAPDI